MENNDLNHSFSSGYNENEETAKIVSKFNKIFGKDIQNLYKSKALVEELNSKQKELEQRLLFATSEAPDKISKAVNAAEKTLTKKDELERQLVAIDQKVVELQKKEKLNSLLGEVGHSLNLIEESEKVVAYQKWISSIEDLSMQIEANLKIEHEDQAFIHYGKLRESAELITLSQCANLKDYTCQMVLHWHSILLTRLEEEFQSVLKTLKWPFVSATSSLKQPPPSQEIMQKLEVLIRHLLQLHVSEDVRGSVKESVVKQNIEEDELDEKLSPSLVSNFTVSSVPLKLLLKPLEVRFLYHFSGEKATNSRKNPEWYLTQVLKWTAIHESFIETYIQPILNQSEHPKVNAKVEFIKGLLRLVVLKLYTDFPEIKDDEDLFCQTVQETLNFEKELRLGLGYPPSQPTVLNVLTQGDIFNKWIAIERKFALELMDDFVASSNSWQSEEEGGLCQCGEQLIMLLQGITDRYKPLSQPGHRLQFLDLQLELLDDFRVRILQLTKSELSDPLHSNYISILNTVHHLADTISDWSDLPFFLEMQYFREKFASVENRMKKSSHSSYTSQYISSEDFNVKNTSNIQQYEISESVFSSILNLYSRIEFEMLSVVSQHVLTEVRARSQSYRRDKWFLSPSESFHSIESSFIPEVSPSLCPLLEALVKHILLLRKNLAPELFSKLWKDLASALNKFIYEEVILQNNFSEYGASQLNHDMSKALFPIFGEFASKPENYFPLVKESVILLTLHRPTAFLLKDTLQLSNSSRDFCSQNSPVKALEERGVFHLSVNEAKIILNIRTNMANL